jgi:hypothetical protein
LLHEHSKETKEGLMHDASADTDEAVEMIVDAPDVLLGKSGDGANVFSYLIDPSMPTNLICRAQSSEETSA